MQPLNVPYAIPFEQTDKSKLSVTGGKGSNLGELTQAGFPVPPGFVMSTRSYRDQIVKTKALPVIAKAFEGINFADDADLERRMAAVEKAIRSSGLIGDIRAAAKEAYRAIDCGEVAARSSAIAEDQPDASFAGQQKTCLCIEGEQALEDAILECFASLFDPRAVAYRDMQGYGHFQQRLAVVVQRMVHSAVSGVGFSDFVTQDGKKGMLISAIFGLGELIVGGEVDPDRYLVDVSGDVPVIIEKDVKVQDKMMVSGRDEAHPNEYTRVVALTPEEGARQKLTDGQIIELASMIQKIKGHYGGISQDVEWAFDEDGKLWILQARPLTLKQVELDVPEEPETAAVLVKGNGIGVAVGVGKIKRITGKGDMHLVESGDVLTMEMTMPDVSRAIKKASAVATKRGGVVCHAAIICSELEIPAVIGIGDSLDAIPEDTLVTIDGKTGRVFQGVAEMRLKWARDYQEAYEQFAFLETKTKVMAIIGHAEAAREVAAKGADGVALYRLEDSIVDIGIHPWWLIREGYGEDFVRVLQEGMVEVGSAFEGKPVTVRLSDMRSDEMIKLEGAEEFERTESNPMLAKHGIYRHIRHPDQLMLELEAFRRARLQCPNLKLMVPFVRKPYELELAIMFMETAGLRPNVDFPVVMMFEIPNNFVQLQRYRAAGAAEGSIGSNDGTQSILCIDRNDEEMAKEFDEMDPGVLWFFEHLIREAAECDFPMSFCGQALSRHARLAELFVKWGLPAAGVTKNVLATTRLNIRQAEEKLGFWPGSEFESMDIEDQRAIFLENAGDQADVLERQLQPVA